MSPYVTRVQVWFNSEGTSPSEVIRKLTELGFTPVRGVYDFIYEHSQSDMNDGELGTAIIHIADALHTALSGFKILYTLDTHYSTESSEYIPLADIDAELEATRKELSEIEKEVE
jgi:hypothetical protein